MLLPTFPSLVFCHSSGRYFKDLSLFFCMFSVFHFRPLTAAYWRRGNRLMYLFVYLQHRVHWKMVLCWNVTTPLGFSLCGVMLQCFFFFFTGIYWLIIFVFSLELLIIFSLWIKVFKVVIWHSGVLQQTWGMGKDQQVELRNRNKYALLQSFYM